jgi:hypothetical protein
MNQVDTGRSRSRGKVMIFSIIMFLVLWFLTDTAMYVALWFIGESKSVFFRIRPATSDEQITRWYKELPFHARWGFDIADDTKGQFGNRKGREYAKKDLYKIKVFGDSFAFGAWMNDRETFEALIEEQTGWEALNYGVVGYGTDQAVLKYEDNGIKTRYSILTVLDENIERNVTMCRGLLTGTLGLMPKPRFAINPDGSMGLLENPVKNVSELAKLKDIAFLQSLKEHDYWAKYYEALNAPVGLTWPATVMLASHYDYLYKGAVKQVKYKLMPSYESHYARWPHNHLYEEGSEGIRVLRHILKQFAATAVARNEVPIVLIFPKRDTMQILQSYRKKPYQTLVDSLRTEGLSFIDFGDQFVDRNWHEYYVEDGHYSRAGNQIIADELVTLIRQLDQQSATQ